VLGEAHGHLGDPGLSQFGRAASKGDLFRPLGQRGDSVVQANRSERGLFAVLAHGKFNIYISRHPSREETTLPFYKFSLIPRILTEIVIMCGCNKSRSAAKAGAPRARSKEPKNPKIATKDLKDIQRSQAGPFSGKPIYFGIYLWPGPAKIDG
jgi:hypothetical protein